ncbi:hypothetical protein BX600DRAFT_483297 [Xylariales sp. PMI_506]|nr:hypothetical protein BX600DRAFT_483297 [Xylariales sp. PMI_506]
MVLQNGKQKKPLLVMTAAPAAGHTGPLLLVARDMLKKGFEVIFMTSPEFKEKVESLGAEYYETTSFFPEGTIEARLKIPVGPVRLMYDLEFIFTANLKPRSTHMRSLLEMVGERDPSREVVIINETASMAVMPFMHGAPLPKGFDKFPKVININNMPLSISSMDTAPFGTGLPPDASEQGRGRNMLLGDMLWGGLFKGANDANLAALKELGCTVTGNIFDLWANSYDTFFQMCSPGLDYPRSDLHPSIRYAGAIPKGGLSSDLQYPSWWTDITTNQQLPPDSPVRKSVVVISQGTIATDYREMLIPAIKGLSDRDDLIVIALLGVKGSEPPADLEVPANTHMLDYFPYDAILEYADVFVTNSGFGSMMHGVINGVPMVMAGMTEDKIEVSARGEYAGFAINLKTQTPTSKQVSEAVDKVLTDPKYKLKAVRHMQENEDLDSLAIITREVMKYAPV